MLPYALYAALMIVEILGPFLIDEGWIVGGGRFVFCGNI